MKTARRTRRLILTFCLVLLFIQLVPPISAASFNDPNFFEEQISTNIGAPTSMAFAPDGRLFVLRQDGQILIYKNGAFLATPFIQLAVNNTNERGLLGIAFDPNFSSNQYLYLYYTTDEGGTHNRLSRFTADGDVAEANSEVILLDLDLVSANNHNGGHLDFGDDDKLYVAVGDGGSNPDNAQDRSNLFGSILRFNPDGSIPTDNPFYNSLSGDNRAIWAYGLRNPFVFDFQPGTGRMHINDVGQNSFEEIDLGQAGANYGWPIAEGNLVNGTLPGDYVGPFFTYSLTGGVCAITGGAFYNPATSQFPASFNGDYFFADYCADWIHMYDIATDTVSEFATGLNSGVVALEVGPDGSLYYLSNALGGVLYRIYYSDVATPPTFSSQPQDLTVALGQPAMFTCQANGQQPISYQWQRDNGDIPGEVGTSYTITTTSLADNGATFRCIANNPTNQPATSNSATLTVIDGTAPTPSILITLPDSAAPPLYEAGEVMEFVGSYTDPDPADANLPDSAFDWRIDFHHNTHTHPFQPSLPDRRSDSLILPAAGHVETTVWYRVYLTVTDSSGLSTTVTQDIFPLVVQVTLDSNPSGLPLRLDGQQAVTPIVTDSVSGVSRVISAPAAGTLSGQSYVFDNWAHGGAATQTITTPPIDTQYTANYIVGVLPPSNGASNSSRSSQGSGSSETSSGLNWTLLAEPPVVSRGESINWQGTLTNNTGAALNELAVEIMALSSVDLVSISISQGSAEQVGTEVAALPLLLFADVAQAQARRGISWYIGDLAPGATATIRLRTPIPASYAASRVSLRAEIRQNAVPLTDLTVDVLIVDALPGTGQSPLWRQALLWCLRLCVLFALIWLLRGLSRRLTLR